MLRVYTADVTMPSGGVWFACMHAEKTTIPMEKNEMWLRAFLTVAAVAVSPNLAFAHAALVRSSPGSRAVVTRMPDHIDLCFNEAVEVKFSTVQITDEKGTTIPISELKRGADPKCLSATVPPAAAGVYTLKYRVLSQDGHVVEYGYQFAVKEKQPVP